MACGQQAPVSGVDAEMQSRIEAVQPALAPSLAACQALEDQVHTQNDVFISFDGAQFFVPYSAQALWVYDDGHTTASPDYSGYTVLDPDDKSTVLCTFDLQNGLVRNVAY